ncbi:MAG: 2Fe-2S iron-sulfur cluster-binding protein [Rhodobacteraceae bacterium]|nr:2Fe-2S iron-sulfur cluster-binding protein [Paracoccaceae bacterium]
MSGSRLPTGGKIDRDRTLAFQYNGQTHSGFAGDTLASALLGSGLRLATRSYKYHRPRGIVSSGIEEPSCHVHLTGDNASGSEPATRVELTDGLTARSVRGWPSASLDLAACLQLAAPLMPAAFYYKTFQWPNWQLFEPTIRKLAGLAPAPVEARQLDDLKARNWHCDVLIVGAGPAGLAAAQVVAEAGLDVLVVDQETEFGGSLLSSSQRIGGVAGHVWAKGVTDMLAAARNVRLLHRTVAWACREHNLIMLAEHPVPGCRVQQRVWRVRARTTILAAGSHERPIVFANNDRPGIMLASAVRDYAVRYAVAAGRQIVFFTNNDSVYHCARELQEIGMKVAGIVDVRWAVSHDVLTQARGTTVHLAHEVFDTRGRRGLAGVRIRPVTGGRSTRISCDVLGLSGGWNPAIQLWSQCRLPVRYSDSLATLVPDGKAADMLAVGGCNGAMQLQEAIQEGISAGAEIARRFGLSLKQMDPPVCDSRRFTIQPYWHSRNPSKADKAFVDLLHDVTLRDIHLAISEGFSEIEHVKRYTTAGMALDQGRTGNLNVAGAVATRLGKDIAKVGTTTFRPPTVPVHFAGLGQFGGLGQLPYRTTPVAPWHISQNAVMYEAGARWRRPGYYPRNGESMHECVCREANAVRNGLGIYDGGPLGTFDLNGRDTAGFLDLVYTNVFSTLEDYRGRYGLMLGDDGLILDDGVSFRLGRDRFLMSTSTANAQTVQRHLERLLAVDYPSLDVKIVEVTSMWMNATICGPFAREALEEIGTDIDLSNNAFPFMAIRFGRVAGIEARVARVSFTGELSYEINVRSRHLAKLWNHVIESCRRFDITPVGSETNHVLRVEKGFMSLGHEVDGTVDAHDLGMGWIMSSKKQDYIGKRAVMIRRQSPRPRRQLVGLLTKDPEAVDIEGAPLVDSPVDERSRGFVTASVWSVVHNRSVALGLLEDGRRRIGGSVLVRECSNPIEASVTQPCFYDPDGSRLRS